MGAHQEGGCFRLQTRAIIDTSAMAYLRWAHWRGEPVYVTTSKEAFIRKKNESQVYKLQLTVNFLQLFGYFLHQAKRAQILIKSGNVG